MVPVVPYEYRTVLPPAIQRLCLVSVTKFKMVRCRLRLYGIFNVLDVRACEGATTYHTVDTEESARRRRGPENEFRMLQPPLTDREGHPQQN